MAATGTATSTEKGRRIVGSERQTLAKDLVKRYASGESIRSLAASTGRSYGFVHQVLSESGVQFRGRGGARVRKWKHSTTGGGVPVMPPASPDVAEEVNGMTTSVLTRGHGRPSVSTA